MSEPAPRAGLFDSLRQLLATAVAVAQVRLELLATDLELERNRLVGGALYALLGLMLLGLGLVLGVVLVLLLLWDSHRIAALVAMIVLFAGVGLALLHHARRRLASGESLLSATTAELARDRAALEGRDERGG